MIIDRIVELEKLQKQTLEFEKHRRDQAKQAKERAQARSRLGGARIQCAKVWREKRCCVDCLQVCCVGDCNEHKKYSDTLCVQCDENHQEGPCNQVVYESRSRGQLDPEEDSMSKTPNGLRSRPKSCNSCKRQTNAKLINANYLVLGRPKSGHATFARGQSSAKPRDLRPQVDSAISATLEEDFEKLGIDATQGKPTPKPPKDRPNTACSERQRHFKGRVGIVPGKSYFSQRRMSLTDRSGRQRMKSATQKRKPSFRKQRPKTAFQ